MSFFNLESPLMQKLSLLWDLMVLNILTILLSVPVFTMGTAVTALYDTVWRMRNHQGTLLRNYWKAFGSNFRKSTLLFLPILFFGVILSYNLMFIQLNNTSGQNMVLVPLILGFVLWAMVTAWVFPLQSRFENTWGKVLVNSFICAIRYLPKTITMVILNATPWVVLILLPELFVKLGILWGLLWFSLAAYWNLMLLEKPLQHLTELSVSANTQPAQEELP